MGLTLCTNHRGCKVYQSCWNDGRTLTFDIYTARSRLLPYAFAWALYIYMEKMVIIINNLLWSFWANVAQISCGASMGQGNERLLKWSWSIDQGGCHTHIWYKTLKKSSSPEPNKPWGLIFAQIIRDRRPTKNAKIMVLCWRLTFLRQGQICFLMHLYGSYTFI